MSGTDYSFLDNPAERDWLTTLEPLDVLKNAHRFYAFMDEAGVSADSMLRELAFAKASESLGVDYEIPYQAWLHEMPVGPAAIRRATRSGK